ncbi:MAG: GNAT family N-acetyltransferase [Verrucomicrobiota bacterium]|nr:GNAT family N-acetyltransferase [Verrucomicrobiota bacterium]
MSTTLDTTRLQLRKFTPDDLEQLVQLTSNPGFMRFSQSGPFRREQAAAMLERLLTAEREGKPSQFAVTLRDDPRVLGYCGFLVQTVDDAQEVEIAYRLDPHYWGRGLASEAAQAVRDHAFRDLNLPRVISLIVPDNLASRRVAEKNGMTIEKETDFRGFHALVYSITRQEWEQLRAPHAGA